MTQLFVTAEEASTLPKTRAEARELGAGRYFTGVACVNGHIEKRLVGTGHCMECDRVRARAKREDEAFRDKDAARLKAMNDAKKAADIDAYRAAQAETQRLYRERLLKTEDGAAKVRAWEEKQNRKYHEDPEYRARKVERDRLRNQREATKERRRALQRVYYRQVQRHDPEFREKGRVRGAQWAKLNKERANAKTAMRRAMRVKATPSWIDAARADEMSLMYAVAQRVSRETGVPHEIDHMVPLNSELVCGLHTPDNLQLLSCHANRAKRNRFEVV